VQRLFEQLYVDGGGGGGFYVGDEGGGWERSASISEFIYVEDSE
jgi:hypothetical protein